MREEGTEVIVKALRKRGVIAAELKPGVYRVQVGALTMTAREDELETPPASKKGRRRSPVTAAPTTGEGPQESGVPTSLDLHGLTVDEARNRVAGYISRAILAGHERVEIIHGIGSGKLKDVVAKDLTSIAAVRAVKPHPTNPGVTLVWL
jgi:DNA mismatch repair protein MutS2